MARMPRDYRLETIDSRRRLPARVEPYWRQVVPGTFLGYRRNSRAGVWVGRHRLADGYCEMRLATADDHVAADGEVVLTYTQAVKLVQQQGLTRHTNLPRHYGDGCTVAAALDTYFLHRRSTNPKSSSILGDEHQANRHIRPCFGARLVNTLITAELQSWLMEIASSQPTVRAKGTLVRRMIKVDLSDPEIQHRRRQTANRIWNVFRAALNHAWRDERNGITSDAAWRRVKPLDISMSEPPRMLEENEIARLINACDSEFRLLVRASLLTGARYGEVASFRAGDYLPDQRSVRIRQTKTKKTLIQPLNAAGVRFFEGLAVGKRPGDLLLTHSDGRPWRKSQQARPMAEAAKKAKLADISFKVTRATYGKLLLLETRDIEMVAKALGHSDSRITRKHYAQYLPNELTQAVQKLPAFGIEMGNVRRLKVPMQA